MARGANGSESRALAHWTPRLLVFISVDRPWEYVTTYMVPGSLALAAPRITGIPTGPTGSHARTDETNSSTAATNSTCFTRTPLSGYLVNSPIRLA
jgi:hypothetical protein